MACCIGEILFQNSECSSHESFYQPNETESEILRVRVKTYQNISKVREKYMWHLQKFEFFQKKNASAALNVRLAMLQ